MAKESGSEPGAGGGGFIVALLIVLAAGAGGGFAVGTLIAARPDAAAVSAGGAPQKNAAAATAPSPAQVAEMAKAAKRGDDANEQVVPLEPILVNVGASERTWLRLEGSVTLAPGAEKERAVLVAEIAEDIAGFLRTTSLAQIESAAGLEFLREDLSELVRLRAKGRAKRFVLRSLVIE